MKKILLLIVSGLLIACMAGSAMATGGIQIKDWPATEPYVVYVSPSGTEKDVTLVFYGMTPDIQHTASVETYSSADDVILDATLTVPSGDSVVAHVNNPAVDAIYTPDVALYECNLHINANGPGTLQVTDIGTGQKYEVTCVIDTEIPEFPTVALPVAAILGLVFIFGRRKEGL